MAAIIFPLSCRQKEKDTIFEGLDRSIDNSESIRNDFESRMGDLKDRLSVDSDSLSKFELCYTLFDGYSLYHRDSASYYLEQMTSYSQGIEGLQPLVQVCRAKYMSLTDAAPKFAGNIHTILESDISGTIIARCYSHIIDICSADPNSYTSIYMELLDSAKQIPGTDNWEMQYYNALKMCAYNEEDSAVATLSSVWNGSSSEYLKARAADRVANIYKSWGEDALYRMWLCRAAQAYISVPSRVQTSLYDLSTSLFEGKDLDRAAKYIHFALDDAVEGQYSNNIICSIAAQQSILQALDEKDNARHVVSFIAITLLLLALFAVTVFWRRSVHNKKKFIKSREDLSHNKVLLADADKIKDGIMLKYMDLSVKYLKQADELRRHYKSILKEQGEKELAKVLRDPTWNDRHYKEFYKMFDETFLGIYPDFISQVNKLFNKEDRFEETYSLCLKLRILAAIKLGVVDSGQIASFLNCSPTSVYSHRSRMKHSSICGSDIFEQKIKKIL